MRVVERGITSSKRCSCWHAARDGAPWEAAFRYERLVAGKETALGAGRPGTQARGGRERGHGGDAIRDESAARSVCLPGRGARGQCHATGPRRPGKPPLALAGQSRRHRPAPESVMHKFG